jgi:hypothetical protein
MATDTRGVANALGGIDKRHGAVVIDPDQLVLRAELEEVVLEATRAIKDEITKKFSALEEKLTKRIEEVRQSGLFSAESVRRIASALPAPVVQVQPANPTIMVESATPSINVQPANPTFTVEPAKVAVNVQPASPTITVQPASPDINVEAPRPRNVKKTITYDESGRPSEITETEQGGN